MVIIGANAWFRYSLNQSKFVLLAPVLTILRGLAFFYNQEKAPKRVVVTTKMAYNEKPQRV
jgi:hypothetical protein